MKIFHITPANLAELQEIENPLPKHTIVEIENIP
jgi:hypothetical protein